LHRSIVVHRISDHAAIGNGRSVALIARDGTIDWLCWPRFDSPAVFAELLDPDAGGWSITVRDARRITRAYVPGTNVLETRIEAAGGTAAIIDAMPVTPPHDLVPEHELVRVVRCEQGEIAFDVAFAPRPGFGTARARLEDRGPFGIACESGSQLLVLRGEAAFALDDRGVARAERRLRAGEAAAFSLTSDGQGPATFPPLGVAAAQRITATIDWWRGWLGSAQYTGRHRELVERSLLVLKLLGYAPSGAIVAAPTTSLPERLGGEANWDYRYCWLRDASLTTRAMCSLGFSDEARAFASWLLHSTRLVHPELRVLYDVFGNEPGGERVLPLTGYRASRPVRVHNAASDQLQLDTYGELVDAITQVVKPPLDHETNRLLRRLAHFVCENWRLPDRGIWERRQPSTHYTYSKAMCWVALDRLLALQLPDMPTDAMRSERAAIRADILARGVHDGAYTGTYDSDEADTSLLLLPWYGFDDAAGERMQRTYRRIADRLRANDGLYYRAEYEKSRGDGAFGIASFWVAEFLALGGGSLEEAERVFDAACRYANDVGLFAEEIDPHTGEALGNFPQAYTHVGLINAALSIHQRATKRRAA
jgi:GH15 family glucan-1,4-alpha-glucosidase